MFFHYNNHQLITQSARVLISKTNPILALLSMKIDGSVKWFTTSSFMEFTDLWRASINKTLQEYLELGWVEHVTIDNIPVSKEGEEQKKFRKRNLWRLSDENIGIEYLFNNSIGDDLFDLGSLVINEKGLDIDTSIGFDNTKIFKTVAELGSIAILNFLSSFQDDRLYYREAVEKIRGNGLSCPKHDKLSKLCDIEFTEIGIDLKRYKLLDREFSPDKSSGAPGYTYILNYPGIKFNIRSSIEEIDGTLFRPKTEDWKNSQVTASQISTLREGIIIGKLVS